MRTDADKSLAFILTDSKGHKTKYSFSDIERMRAKDLNALIESGDFKALTAAEQAMYEPGAEHVIAYGRYLEAFKPPHSS